MALDAHMSMIQVLDAYLNEELGVEGTGGGVEGRSSNVGVDLVLSRDGVCSKQVHELNGGEASISHAGEDLACRVGWLGDGQVRSRARNIGTTRHELQAWPTTAV